MSFADAVARELMTGHMGRVVSPEFRQIELGGTRRPILSFDDPEPFDHQTVAEVTAVVRAHAGLEAVLGGSYPWDDERSSWRRHLDLPRGTRAERAAAEVYRRVRLVGAIAVRPGVRMERRDALVYLGVDVDKEIYEVEITSGGLALLELGAAKLVEFRNTPYPETWVEAYLTTLLADLTAETKAFHDEDNYPQQFRAPFPFNRHRRFDCENPRTRFVDDGLEIEIPEAFKDAAVFAIDFHTIVDERLHIIPVEALTNGRLPTEEIPAWRARVPDGRTLPAQFRRRFTRASRADPPSKRL